MPLSARPRPEPSRLVAPGGLFWTDEDRELERELEPERFTREREEALRTP